MHVSLLDSSLDLDDSVLDASPETVRRQVREYERGERRAFDVPVAFPDSFTGRVMRELDTIPYGETRTYGEIAARLDTSPIAVGGACGRNPVPLVVPCHRVVGVDSLKGYSGAGGVDLKRALLVHEGVRDVPALP